MKETTSKAPATVDIQDPLPEANWFWRRVFVFLVTLALLYMVWGAMDRLAAAAMLQPRLGIPALLTLGKWLTALAGMVVTYYMVAPSAEQITKMLQTAGLLKAGVQIAQRTVETPERKETVATVATPPAPVVPPATAHEDEDFAPTSSNPPRPSR